ncbi:MAG: N-acetylmuramoyl-L-alanine amidase, partial [Anaerolineaceae bacterium]
ADDLLEEKPAFFSIIRAFQSVLMSALLAASLFTLFTPSNLFSGSSISSMLFSAEEPTPKAQTTDQPVSTERVGIVSGHWKDAQNSGFMCSDGTAENTLNLQIATMVMQKLSALGYQADLLEEHDARLSEYQALAVISIHNDTCEFLGNESSGFKAAPALANAYPDEVDKLTQCLINRYASATGLKYINKQTADMTTYHSFNEVHSLTPVVVMETGYLNLDRQILTRSTDVVVQGIVDGIVCYLEGGSAAEATTAP